MRAVALLLVSFVALTALSSCGSTDSKGSFVERANAELAAGNPEEGERLLRSALDSTPNDPALRSSLAAFLFKRGKADDAIAEWQELVARDPQNADAHYNLGLAFFSKGDIEKAEAELRAALAVTDNHAPAHSDLGVVLEAKGETDEAMASWERALAIDPTYTPAHANLARSYAKRRDYDLSVLHYQAAINTEPGLPDPYIGLAIVYDLQQQPDRAQAILRHALSIPAVSAEAAAEIADRSLAANKQDEAIAAYRRAIEVNPSRSLPYEKLSLIYRSTGRPNEALDAVNDGIDRLERSAALLAIRGQIHFDADKFDAAREDWRKALVLDQTEPRALAGLGILYQRDGRQREALDHLERAARSPLAGGDVVFFLGEMYRVRGRNDEALRAYERSAMMDPEFAPVQLRLAEAYIGTGRRKEALEAYRAYMTLERGDQAARVTPRSAADLKRMISEELHGGLAPEP